MKVSILTVLCVYTIIAIDSSLTEEIETPVIGVAAALLATNPVSSRHPQPDTIQKANVVNGTSPQACVRCSYPCSSYCCNVPPSICCVYSGGRCYCSSSPSWCY